MFTNIHYNIYNKTNKYNSFVITDSCLGANYIRTPYGSPSLESSVTAISNALALYALIKFYEKNNRNIPLNLSCYYQYLYCQGYSISKHFITSHLSILEDNLNIKVKKYLNSILFYLKIKFNHTVI